MRRAGHVGHLGRRAAPRVGRGVRWRRNGDPFPDRRALGLRQDGEQRKEAGGHLAHAHCRPDGGSRGCRVLTGQKKIASSRFELKQPNEQVIHQSYKNSFRKKGVWLDCVRVWERNAVSTIDYRCEDGSFPKSVSCVNNSNPVLLSSSKTGVNPGIKSRKGTYLNGLEVRKP